MPFFALLCDPNAKRWYFPLLSIGVTFLAGLSLIIIVKLLRTARRKFKYRKRTLENLIFQEENLVNQDFEDDFEGNNVGYLTKVQDWASNFISGKSKFATALVCTWLI